MRRFSHLLLTLALLFSLAACGNPPAGASSPASSAPAETAQTEPQVLAAYEVAAEVYDWFNRASLPFGDDAVALDGAPFDPNADGIPYFAVESTDYPTYADLESAVRAAFAPALADKILADGVNYRDIGGKLYCAGGARGSSLYLLDKTVAAERVDDDHWTVTLTFWADFLDSREVSFESSGDTLTRTAPVATVGYSQAALDYVNSPEGWRFTTFCPSDGLDEDADTVCTIDYYHDFEETSDYLTYSDWKLVCYLIHADGAYSQAPIDLLYQRFMERPAEILTVLALLDASPYASVYSHVPYLVASPGYSAVSWHYEQVAEFKAILDGCSPKNDGETAVLEKIRTAFEAGLKEG